MDVIVIAGSPATGKTTIARAVQSTLGGAHIDLGRIREMYLDTGWSGENPEEAQMAFLISCDIARVFVANEIKPVVLEDLRPEHIHQIPLQFEDISFAIVTLFVKDRAVLQKRMHDPSRVSGFNSIEAAWKWNLSEQERKLLPNEVRLDTTNLTTEDVCKKICKISEQQSFGK